MNYIVKQALNNNVVLVSDKNGVEHIFIGNGIGFNLKTNQSFTRSEKVKKEFVLKDRENIRNYMKMIDSIDLQLVSFLEEEMAVIETKCGKKFNEKIHVSLIDHIAFAIQRHKDNLDFHNPLDKNIQIMYSQEYGYASDLIDRLNEKFNVGIVKDETGILAIHLHAATREEGLGTFRTKVEIVSDIIDKIYASLLIEKDTSSYSYQRLLIHTNYAIDRLMQNETIEIDEKVIETIKMSYGREFQMVSKILDETKKEYGFFIPELEIAYLTIHAVRIIQEKEGK